MECEEHKSTSSSQRRGKNGDWLIVNMICFFLLFCFVFLGACKKNEFAVFWNDHQKKEDSCLAIFKSVLLMRNFILSITGENDFSMCGVLLNFVENENLAKSAVENLSNE